MATRSAWTFGFVFWLAISGWALAAELPSKSTKPSSEPKIKTCEIDGEPGFRTAGDVCLRIGGYVSAGVAAGNLKSH